MRIFIALLIAAVLSLSWATLSAQEKTDTPPPPKPADIAPPADLELELPPPPDAEAIPKGRVERGDAVRGDDLLRRFGPEGRRIGVQFGDRGLEFGLDMAERGISFGLRYAEGRAGPADARAFGIDMGRRGRAFGLKMRDRGLRLGDELEGELNGKKLPVDGRDADFQETPGDLTIEAPPLPDGAAAPPRNAQPKVFGRELTERPVRFRREF